MVRNNFLAAFMHIGCFCFFSATTAHAQMLKAASGVHEKNQIPFKSYEDLRSPKFDQLRKKYRLDTVFHGETDELKRILLLRNWIRKTITINDPGPHPGDGSCESILEYALKGNGYHCQHFMVVQNAIMNAYGYVTRCLGAGPGGIDGKQDHHGINEIWLNSYQKWFVCDAKYNSHFEKNGIPLSALEVRDEFLKNRAADIVRVKGVERTVVDRDNEYQATREEFARTYGYLEWDMFNDRYVRQPAIKGDRGILVMYNDTFFKEHPWMWDGKPHWAWHTKFMYLEEDRRLIEWKPNTVKAVVKVTGSKATIELNSVTPNFKTYQFRELPAGEWVNTNPVFSVVLKNTSTEYKFRAVNLADVTGPECTVIIKQH